MIAAADLTSLAYAAIMLTAIVAGAILLKRSQAGLPLAMHEKLSIGLGAFTGAMLGAKLPFALLDWEGLRSGTVWLSDGKTIMTGLAGAYLGVEIVKWALEIRVKTGDSFAAPTALAVGIGRVGCFIGGCCFGTPTSLPWGIAFEKAGDSLPRHPTQLYEAAFHFAACGILLSLRSHGIWRGQLAKAYILAYLAYRFASEFIRPEPQVTAGLSIYQLAALALAPIFLGLWYADARRFAETSGAIDRSAGDSSL